MIHVQMAASELGFDLHYGHGNTGEPYFVIVDHRLRIANLFDDTESNRNMAINYMHKVRERENRRARKKE